MLAENQFFLRMSLKIDLNFVWVVQIDLISVWGIGLNMIPV